MEGDGLRAEGEFLFLFCLCRERLENRVLETALVSTLVVLGCWISFLRPTLIHTKNLYENGPNPFFIVFFQSYGYENGPDSYGQIRLSFS